MTAQTNPNKPQILTDVDLRELRQRQGIKQKDLAAHLHISPSKLAKVEKGVLELNLHQADLFAQKLGISIEQVNVSARVTRGRYNPPPDLAPAA